MDILLGIAAVVVMISVPTVLSLIYLELRQRRMFGAREIFPTGQVNNDTAAIAMSLQAEIERLRADVHGAMTAVSTDIERVRDHIANTPPAQVAAPAVPIAPDSHPHIDVDRSTAISELYSALSRLDIAFLAVARPVLLPGEAFDLETDLPREAFLWESWNNVGSAAYQFAEVFSERRIRLDPVTRDHLNTSLGSIRRNLTAQLYPALTDVDGSIPESQRETVAQVVATLASDIQEIRIVLEHAMLPSMGNN